MSGSRSWGRFSYRSEDILPYLHFHLGVDFGLNKDERDRLRWFERFPERLLPTAETLSEFLVKEEQQRNSLSNVDLTKVPEPARPFLIARFHPKLKPFAPELTNNFYPTQFIPHPAAFYPDVDVVVIVPPKIYEPEGHFGDGGYRIGERSGIAMQVLYVYPNEFCYSSSRDSVALSILRHFHPFQR